MIALLRTLSEFLVDLHAPLAGAATSLVLDTFGADGQTTVLVGLAAAAGLQLIAYAVSIGPRSACERTIAARSRSVLDRHLEVVRIDPVGVGDFLTLRDLAAAAREGRLRTLVGNGGPAMVLGRVLGKLVRDFETEVGRCYLRLRSARHARVDAFVDALRAGESAANDMVRAYADIAPPERAEHGQKLFARLTDAITAIEALGNELDETLDRTAYRAAMFARMTSSELERRRTSHAAAVLLRSARDAAQALQLQHVRSDVPIVAPALLLERLKRAQDHLRTVDAQAFHDATDDARNAHRRISQHDLGDATEAATRLVADPTDAEAETVLRHRIGRFPLDLATLEAVADGRTRDVPPWPGAIDPEAPTLGTR